MPPLPKPDLQLHSYEQPYNRKSKRTYMVPKKAVKDVVKPMFEANPYIVPYDVKVIERHPVWYAQKE